MATAADTLSRAFEIYYDRYENALTTGSRRISDRLASNWNQINSLYDIVSTAVAEDNDTRAQEALNEIVAILNGEGISIAIPPTPPLAIGISVSPSSIAVPTDKDGGNSDYSNAFADVQITEGQTDRTNDWTYTPGSVSNVTAAITGNRVEITSLTADSGTYEVLCNRDGYSQLSVNIGVVRQKQGEDGTAAWSKSGNNLYYNDGNVGIATDTPLARLHLGGVGSLSEGLVFGDGDTGIYQVADNQIDFACGGVRVLKFDQGGFDFANNAWAKMMREQPTATNPVFTPGGNNDKDTGIGWAGADQLSLIAGGVEAMRFYSTKVTTSLSLTVGGNNVYGRLTVENGNFVVVGNNSQILVFNDSLSVAANLRHSTTIGGILELLNDAGTINVRMFGDTLSGAFPIAYFRGGSVVIGKDTVTDSTILELDSTTGAFLLPRMTTAERNSLTAVNGMMIYNSATNEFNVYRNGSWRIINTGPA